jgi:hypothetical protein
MENLFGTFDPAPGEIDAKNTGAGQASNFSLTRRISIQAASRSTKS